MNNNAQMTQPNTRQNLWGLSLGEIIFAVALSFVDLMFLNEVIGRVLDFGPIESMIVAFGLGLVGITIMASAGAMMAHEEDKPKPIAEWGLYLLWITLGISFVILRIISATILQLDPALGDEALFNVGVVIIRQSDLILGPIMFLLYIATGLMARNGVKNLISSHDFLDWWQKRKERIAREKQARTRKAQQAETIYAASKDLEIEVATYNSKLNDYHGIESKLMTLREEISQNIEDIKQIDRDEKDFETNTKTGYMKIFNDALRSSQGETALLMNKHNGGGIEEYRDVINRHNSTKDGLN